MSALLSLAGHQPKRHHLHVQKAGPTMPHDKSNHCVAFEGLEQRRLMSAGSDVAPVTPIPARPETDCFPPSVEVSLDTNGVLRVIGTKHDDHVTVQRRGDRISVHVALHSGVISYPFELAKVKKVRAVLGNGDDVFAAKGLIRFRMTVEGGDGNDNLVGGIGRDRIDGGAGDDVVVGAEGVDELIGGSGRDVIDALARESLTSTLPVVLPPPSSAADVIRADDGEADEIVYGLSEVVHADARDLRPAVQLLRFTPIGSIGD
jgi:hypothetical protein